MPEIIFPPRLKHTTQISKFLQMMVNRLRVGQARHADKGDFDAAQDYLKRLKSRIREYERTGNAEFLVDAANYALLEFWNPLHPGYHFKSVDSRGRTI